MSLGDAAQVRRIVEQVLEAERGLRASEPAQGSATATVLKWVAGVFGAIASGVFIAGCVWLFSTLSSVQLSLRDVTNALGSDGVVQARFKELDRRVSNLEEIHKSAAKRGTP